MTNFSVLSFVKYSQLPLQILIQGSKNGRGGVEKARWEKGQRIGEKGRKGRGKGAAWPLRNS